jgi:hypothetical protein
MAAFPARFRPAAPLQSSVAVSDADTGFPNDAGGRDLGDLHEKFHAVT